ncbi:hypothetical protein DXD25_02115 [Prevotella sp. TF12-30]|uniref:hypothetical protein n=1 Tax=Prevotellaceae TaxID=171552 RepID=UPI000E44ED90|nr:MULTISPECIES: hypothetical protein [Prevotellaceae]RGK35174.1 hypothetical protein DXD25_02115 [Prevotella sp. TF12-30]
MKVINSKLAAIGLAAFVFASCSDSNSDPTGPTPNVELAETITANLTSSSAAELAARVSNYKNTTANARKFFFSRATQTRAFASADKVVIPAVPENARQWTGDAEDMTAGKTYLITSKKTLDMSGHKVAGTTIFIKGSSKLIFDSSIAGCTIYVDGGATLEYKGKGALEIPADATIINDGGSIIAENDITVAGKLYAKYTNEKGGIGSINAYDKNDKKAIITPKHNITFKNGSEAYIGGSIRAVELNIEEGATVNATKHIMNATTVNVDGALQFGGFLRTETLNVKGEMIASEHSAIKASKVFNAEAGSSITADYINVTDNKKNEDGSITYGNATLNLKGNCKININNKSDIYTNNIVTDNASAGQITLNDDNAIAVIKAKKFTNNGDNQIKALATSGNNATFLLQFTECYTGTTKENTFEDLDIAASYLDYDKATDGKGVKEKADGPDYKAYGYEWAGDPAKIIAAPKLDLVAEDKTPNNGLSATCIQPGVNGKFYVAYHTNGKASNGAIEAISLANNTLTINQSVESDNATNDYNHILVDGNTLWVAGSQSGNKSHADEVTGVGPFMGQISLNGDGTIANKIQISAINRKTKGMDANCVANFKNNHIVATTNGFTIFNAKMNKWNEGSTEGKYLVAANGKLYALTVDGTLTAYNDNEMQDVAATYNVGAISPKGNKAVIAVDEAKGEIYVCKGENGISKIAADGTVSQFFDCPTFKASNKAENLEAGKEYVKGCANGVYVTANNVFVACGSYGLVVLDKNGKEVCHRKAYNGKSANFVTGDNDNNIFVAYGQSRVQVFKLTNTKK